MCKGKPCNVMGWKVPWEKRHGGHRDLVQQMILILKDVQALGWAGGSTPVTVTRFDFYSTTN